MNEYLVLSYQLDDEPTFPTEEMAHEEFLRMGGDVMEEVECYDYE